MLRNPRNEAPNPLQLAIPGPNRPILKPNFRIKRRAPLLRKIFKHRHTTIPIPTSHNQRIRGQTGAIPRQQHTRHPNPQQRDPPLLKLPRFLSTHLPPLPLPNPKPLRTDLPQWKAY